MADTPFPHAYGAVHDELRRRLHEAPSHLVQVLAGQQIHYWREEPLAVDLVSTGSWGRWAIEVKTGPLGVKALAGVLEFCRRNPRFEPAIVCDPGQESVAATAGVVATPWPQFLLEGPPRR